MKKVILGVLAIVVCAFTFPAKEVKLQYTFTKGDTYDFSQTASITQQISTAGFEQNIETKIAALIKMKVIEVTSTGGKFEVEYDGFSLSSRTGQGTITMDSKGDTSNVQNKLIRALIGKKFNFTMTRNGSVESVENIDNLWSGLNSKQGVDQAQLMQVRQSLEQTIGKQSFKSSIESAFANYPEHKVQAGTTWKHSSQGGNSIPMNINNVWTVESIAEPHAILINDAQITTTDTTKAVTLQQGIKAIPNLKGRTVLKSTVSLKSGWPQSGKSYSEIKGKMLLLAGGPIPQDMDMTTETKSDSEFTLTKK